MSDKIWKISTGDGTCISGGHVGDTYVRAGSEEAALEYAERADILPYTGYPHHTVHSMEIHGEGVPPDVEIDRMRAGLEFALIVVGEGTGERVAQDIELIELALNGYEVNP